MDMKINKIFKNMKTGRVSYKWKHTIKRNKGEITNEDVIDIIKRLLIIPHTSVVMSTYLEPISRL